MWKCRDGQWRHTSWMNLYLHQSEFGPVHIMSIRIMGMPNQVKETAFDADAWKGSPENTSLTVRVTAYGRADEACLDQAHVLRTDRSIVLRTTIFYSDTQPRWLCKALYASQVVFSLL